MAKTLIIAEKPSVACKIAAVGQKCLGSFTLPISKNVLTDDYLKRNEQAVEREAKRIGKLENDKFIIMFASGHLVQLFQAEDYNPAYKNWAQIPYPFIPSEFKLKVMEDSKCKYEALESMMNSSEVNEIWVATDADREGQNIYALIEAMAGCKKPTKRLWVDAFTPDRFERAVKDMKPNSAYAPLSAAGFCRMVADWLMGGLLTGKATVSYGGFKNMISVGRVQTAVLNEIVRVELLNRNHKTRKYYVLKGKFQTKTGEVYEGICDVTEYDTAADAQAVINKLGVPKTGTVDSFVQEQIKSYSPPLHNQTSLQIAMSQNANISPDDTLAASQSLYEKGHASYPRTGSKVIASGEAQDFETMLKLVAKINPLSTKHAFNKNNKRIVNDAEVEGHSAITPTIDIPNLNSLSSNERAVYEELVRRSISVVFPPAVDQKDEAFTNVKGIAFKSTGIKELERGWREVYNTKEKDNPLPLLSNGEEVSILELCPKEVETKPPKRHTEDSILAFMENCGKKLHDEEKKNILKDRGIGTPATRSEILPKLMRSQYIFKKKDGKTLYPTDKGIEVIQIFPVDELKSPEYTADMELQLYRVEKGELSKDQYMKEIIHAYKAADAKITTGEQKIVSDSAVKCPVCQKGELKKRTGQYGDFYSCTGYKEGCKFTINAVCGKLPTEAQVKTMLSGKKITMKGLRKKDGTELPDAYASFDKEWKIALNFSAGLGKSDSGKSSTAKKAAKSKKKA